jgi:hypothetical protein
MNVNPIDDILPARPPGRGSLFDFCQIGFCLLSKENEASRPTFAPFTKHQSLMKVLLLGAGSMGKWAAQTAAAFPRVSRLTIADRNLPAARALAAQCEPKAEAMGLDVEDTDALRAALHGHQAVLNCVGPYYRFGLPILQAAIGAGCHYLDLCDDWEPTLDMLRLHDAARGAGITAVIGLGASPGVSNLLALQLPRSFDQVTQLHTGWRVESAWGPDPDGKEDGSQAAIEHWVHGFTAPIAVQESGSRQIKAPWSRSRCCIRGWESGPSTPWAIRKRLPCPERFRACKRVRI